MWLFATYGVKLPKPVLLKSESGEPIVVSLNLKGWESEITLIPSTGHGRINQSRDGAWYYPVSMFEITVVRDGELGDEMVHAEAAKASMERLLVFLQFKVWNSFFTAIEKYQQYFSLKAVEREQCDSVQLLEPQLDLISDYTQQNLRDYMSEYFSSSLCRGLLHDAQISMTGKRNRRACLELSMACEVALGMRLEDAGQVKASMGTVFKNKHSQAYEDIFHLFQMRDALKQRGEGVFKFVSVAKRQIMARDLTRWQGAVECLGDWLNAMNKGLQEAQ